ncbi:MAG: hypothetical protein IAB19_05645, partial [Proteobacteria bacterium]|nr:hypothetical protein [Candidatus Avisuccinivibrio stercorigallinarum]
DLPAPAAAQSSDIDGKGLDSGSILWIETRAMTGGSRNILDLSKTAIIASGSAAGTLFETDNSSLMQGCAVFFGIDPENTEVEKEITLRFENIDYFGNKIIYPTGSHANGTWRLQIRGTAADGTKITKYLSSVKNEPDYFTNKIAVFTKIDVDYYELTIYPIDELEKLKQASKVTAYNGPNSKSKLIGIIDD